MNGGQKAVSNGQSYEEFAENALKRWGYQRADNAKGGLFKKREWIGNVKCYAKNVNVGVNIFGRNRIVEFFVCNRLLFPCDLILECKWQQSPGSVDEKYPHLYENILKTDIPTIVLVGGGGSKPESRQWLKDRVDRNVLLAVWEMEEFQCEVNNGLFDTGDIPIRTYTRKKDEKSFYNKDLWDFLDGQEGGFA
jgi:hypothetical protein